VVQTEGLSRKERSSGEAGGRFRDIQSMISTGMECGQCQEADWGNPLHMLRKKGLSMINLSLIKDLNLQCRGNPLAGIQIGMCLLCVPFLFSIAYLLK
jgi:hypothetical protein